MRREKNKNIVVEKGKRMSLSPVLKFENPALEAI